MRTYGKHRNILRASVETRGRPRVMGEVEPPKATVSELIPLPSPVRRLESGGIMSVEDATQEFLER